MSLLCKLMSLDAHDGTIPIQIMGESYEISKLSNNADLCLIDTPHDERLQVSISFPAAGTSNSLPDKPGLPHLTEHVMFAGCEALPSTEDFWEVIAADGASANAFTREGYMRYTLLAGEHWDIALKALVSAIEAPLFLPAAIAREREVAREELTGYLSMPVWQLWPRLRKAVGYQTNNDPVEHLAALDSITPEDLREFHARTHRTDGMQVVATGSMGHGRAEAIRSIVADIQLDASPPSIRPPIAPTQPEAPTIVNRPDRSSIYYRLGNYGLTQPGLDAEATSSLLIGKLFDYQRSTIKRAGRDRNILYTIGGAFDLDTPGKNMFYIHGNNSPVNATHTWHLVREALATAVDPSSGVEDFEAVQRNTIGRAVLRLYDTEFIHSRAVRQFSAYSDILPSDAYIQALRDTTPDTYTATLGRLFQGGVAAVGAVGKDLTNPDAPLVRALQETQDYLAGLSR